MSENDEIPQYHSYLLRCWLISPAHDGEPARWRFALRDVAAEPKEIVFGTSAQLVAFLEGGLSAAEDERPD